jgi:glycosyltransferase involved in cell wall biosynthesis
MPFFSTIIAAFNRGGLIRATLDSAISQNEDDAALQEIIVVDDGSTDETPAILQQYVERYPDRMRVIRQDNAGPGGARNRGILEAKGEYICFLDSDDLWFPWTLETYRKVIEQRDRPSVLLATAQPFVDAADFQSMQRTEPIVERFADFFSTAAISFWHGCSAVVVRADVLRAAGGFTERHINAEDTDLWMKLGVTPGLVHLRSPATVGYRLHPASAVADMTRTRDGMLNLIEQERAGHYPGGPERRAQRLTILTRHLRAASMHCLAAGQKRDAWMLYRASFAWNARERRIKFLLGFPAAAAGII